MCADDFVINLDWLSFSVHFCLSFAEKDTHEFSLSEPTGCRLLHLTGTNVYKSRDILYSGDGEKLLTLCYHPFSSVIHPASCLVQVANKWLYTGFQWVLFRLAQIHTFVITNLTRVDICCDFPCTAERYKVINALYRNDYYVQGKKEGAHFQDFEYGNYVYAAPRQLSWGSVNSNIKWKLYNKSLELREVSPSGEIHCSKPYIRDTWAQKGWDVDKVWRLEVSICPAGAFEYKGRRLGYDEACNWFYIADLFQSLYMTRFVIRANQGHKDKTNDRRVYLLGDWGRKPRMSHRPPLESREVVEYISGLRAAMKQRTLPEVIANPVMFDVWTRTAIECVKVGHLQKYFNDVYGVPIERIAELSDYDTSV